MSGNEKIEKWKEKFWELWNDPDTWKKWDLNNALNNIQSPCRESYLQGRRDENEERWKEMEKLETQLAVVLYSKVKELEVKLRSIYSHKNIHNMKYEDWLGGGGMIVCGNCGMFKYVWGRGESDWQWVERIVEKK